ncbi:MAG: hypothetical protein K6E91_05805 [Butyrivibrio sp.]|nr:hypothetical protein [Butyrivibrio sp.]
MASTKEYLDFIMEQLSDLDEVVIALYQWLQLQRRSPEEYEAWFDGVAKECEILELKIVF